MLEAWLVDAEQQQATRPRTMKQYPVVPLVPKSKHDDFLWGVFVRPCGEHTEGCVLLGPPKDICVRYGTLSNVSPSWWIYPRACPDPVGHEWRFETIE